MYFSTQYYVRIARLRHNIIIIIIIPSVRLRQYSSVFAG